MAKEDLDIDDFIKMEIDIDDEDLDDEVFAQWALEESSCEDKDPFLMFKPVVYTTKLDEMETVKQDLRELTANEIIKKLQSENKPTFAVKSMQPPSNSRNMESFIKLSEVVNHINFKSRLQAHITNVRNMKLLMQCKPLNIVLKDIKKLIPATVTGLQNNCQDETTISVTSNAISEVQNKEEAIESCANKPRNLKMKKEMVVKRNQTGQIKSNEIEVINTNELVPITEVNKPSTNSLKTDKTQCKGAEGTSSAKVSKIIELKRNSTKGESSCKKNKITQKPNSVNRESSDEDDTALINLKRKPVTSALQTVSLEKYALIVLLNKKGEAFVYRVNSSKLVTDYYITNQYDEYKLAAMYPKEEKIIENYCCWFKREEVVIKICMRKTYPFSIQKFLSKPHSCLPGNCRCCCQIKKAANQSNQQLKRRDVVQKSVAVADSWIRGLLNRNLPVSTGLVAKALSYIPNTEVKQKPVERGPEKYVAFVLLCFKYSGLDQNYKNVAELYEIGKNGNVVRSFLLDSYEKEKHIRRTYYLMGDVKAVELSYCCWYKREKIMHDLKITKISPIALKLIQTSHNCKRKKCQCCCKSRPVPLKAIQTLPTILKHTTAYEKNVRPLTIRFSVKSKVPINRVNEKCYKSKNVTDVSAAATVLSNCASKEDNPDLSISILSRFKNLKLGVTSDGKLETILNAPARNLSIAELRVLSDILALSTKQITELGLSPEEFCNRINSKSGQPNHADSEISLISALPLQQKINDHTNEQIRLTASPFNQNNDTNDPLLQISPTNLNEGIQNESVSKLTLSPQIQVTHKIETVKKTITSTSKANSAKAFADTFSSISNLMETKNKNYVDSFKSFFRNNVPDVVLPEMSKFPHVAGLITGTETNDESFLCMPKISDTFTLVKSLTKASDIAIPGPSGVTRRPRIELPKIVEANSLGAAVGEAKNVNPRSPAVFNDGNQSPNCRSSPITVYGNSTKRKGPRIDCSQIDKKIRVKSVNEIMATQVLETTVSNNLRTEPVPIWPAPIVIKRDPITNISSIKNSYKCTTIPINPDLHSQAYLVANNTVTASNPLMSIVNTTTGLRYLTITPIMTPVITPKNIDKSMLAQILKTPQVEPTVNGPPPLVPLRSTNVIPVDVKNEDPDPADVEKSISYNLIIDNTERNN